MMRNDQINQLQAMLIGREETEFQVLFDPVLAGGSWLLLPLLLQPLVNLQLGTPRKDVIKKDRVINRGV